jgi:hypothetical protein
MAVPSNGWSRCRTSNMVVDPRPFMSIDGIAMIIKDFARTFGVFAALVALSSSAMAQPEAEALQVVADQVRAQGYACAEPMAVQRDAEASRPDLPVWVLTCEGGRYRVELVPDMRARVTPIN